LEVPKMHYVPSSEADERKMIIDGRADILDMATRLQEVLQLIKQHILVPTRELKDLAAGNLKHILPLLMTTLDQRFDLFKSAIAHYHGAGFKATSSVGSIDSGKGSRQNLRGDYGGMEPN